MDVTAPDTFEAVKAAVVETLGIEDRADTLDVSSPLLGALPELDSMAVMELVFALEQRFEIEFDGEEVSAESFETLGALTALIEAKTR